jgi:SAM-dependent methyltransferase
MTLLRKWHGRHVHSRRVRILARHIAALLPPSARVLDVGCGDGRFARTIQELRPDVSLRGLDVQVRPEAVIPVTPFDGCHLPCAAGEFEIVLFVDVLHHAMEAARLLQEAARVASTAVIVKDHQREGLLAHTTLACMDWVGNAPHGVACPQLYLSLAEWDVLIAQAGLRAASWETRLGLYPWPASLWFERRLHFLSVLQHQPPVDR